MSWSYDDAHEDVDDDNDDDDDADAYDNNDDNDFCGGIFFFLCTSS